MTLAHQLRDLPGFRWAPGMLGIDPTGEGSPIRITARGECVRTADGTSVYRPGKTETMRMPEVYVPDLADDATAGIVWSWLRPDIVAPGDDGASVGVFLSRDGSTQGGSGPTLGEACAALMVARGRCGC